MSIFIAPFTAKMKINDLMFQTLDQQFLELPPLRFARPIGPLLGWLEWRQGPSTSRAGFE